MDLVKAKKRLVPLLVVLSLLPGCGAMDFPMTVGVAAAGMAASKAARMLAVSIEAMNEAIQKSFTCGLAGYNQFINLSDKEIDFYKNILNLIEEKKSTESNFSENIGEKNWSDLKVLIGRAYRDRIYTTGGPEAFIKLTVKGLIHISKTPNSENYNWVISETFEEKDGKIFKIGILIPLKLLSESSKDDLKFKSYCLEND